tara:strand:+ start:2023 stop:3012 length:990 start_codon:yes stop_codon:yes gene_type:complete
VATIRDVYSPSKTGVTTFANFNLIPHNFTIGDDVLPAWDMPCKLSWHIAAQQKGFDLLGRVLDRYHGVVRCHACGALSVVRLNVLRDHCPLCHPCILARRIAAAGSIEAQWLRQDLNDRHYGYFRLYCDHEVRSQYIRVERAAAGGHNVSCESCRETRYAEQASKHDWTLVGAAEHGRLGYRSYQHSCGHTQDVMIGNMVWGDCSCANCGVSWSANKSFIYLFQIALPGLTVLKLGYSARPEKRLRHQLGIDRSAKTEVLRVVPMPTGNLAVAEEQACHRTMKEFHAELVVPKSEFGDGINTLGEIYRREAADILNAMMDEIAQRYGAG